MRTSAIFQPGTYEKAALRILAHHGSTTGTAVYSVVQMCCGREESLKHLAVRKRIHGKSKPLCGRCSSAAKCADMGVLAARMRKTTLPDSEVKLLTEMIREGQPFHVIAGALRRSESTVQLYADKLGLKRTTKERQILRQANHERAQTMIDRQKMADEDRARLGRRRPRPIVLWLKAMMETNG